MKTKSLTITKPQAILEEEIALAVKPWKSKLLALGELDLDLHARMVRTCPVAAKAEADKLFAAAVAGDAAAFAELQKHGGSVELYVRAKTEGHEIVKAKWSRACAEAAPLFEQLVTAVVAALDRAHARVEPLIVDHFEALGETRPASLEAALPVFANFLRLRRGAFENAANMARLGHIGADWLIVQNGLGEAV